MQGHTKYDMEKSVADYEMHAFMFCKSQIMHLVQTVNSQSLYWNL
jgi:hypothetical protein